MVKCHVMLIMALALVGFGIAIYLSNGYQCALAKEGAKSRHLSKSPRGGKVYYGITNGGERFACRFNPPVRVPITAEQSNEVAVAYGQIVAAYENGALEEMTQLAKAFPDVVTNMPDSVFIALSRPVNDHLLNGFLNVNCLKDFSSVADFDEHARLGMALAVFWGNTYLRREDYESPVAFIDTAVLERLLSYKKKFRDERRPDMEKTSDVLINEWKEQIEDINGFTRQFMWYQVDLQWRNYHEGTWTLAQLSDWTKRYANGLIRLGYTPKWLSEFDDLSEAVK